MHWPPLALIVAVGVVIAVINATSGIMEAQTGGTPVDPRASWLFEISSVVMVVALSPAIDWMIWRVPPPGRPAVSAWSRFLALHALAACVFSVLHVVGMVAMRKLGYASAGSVYVFAYHGDLGLPFFYELRKDVLTYTSNAAVYWVWGFWLAHQAGQARTVVAAAAADDGRIEVRDGSRVSLIPPADIAWLEAAGNYVTIHVGHASHLARGTLASFEQRLAAQGFVRVHRSRLVNRTHVASWRTTPSGDYEIRLTDGRTLAGSRRYRAMLESQGD